jgi:hypothetical protein
MLCNVLEVWRFSPHRGGSLNSHIAAEFIAQKLDKKQRIILALSVRKCIQTQSNLMFSIFHTGNHFTVRVCYILWVIAFCHSQWQSIIPFWCPCNSHGASCRCIMNVFHVRQHTALSSTDIHIRIINTRHFQIDINEAIPTCFKFSGSKSNGCWRHW